MPEDIQPAGATGTLAAPPREETAVPDDVTITWRGITEASERRPSRLARMGRSIKGACVWLLQILGVMRRQRPDGSFEPRPWKRLIILGLLVVGTYLVVASTHIVEAGTVQVPQTLGAPGEQLGAGLHITPPWPITTTTALSVRTEAYTMTKTRGEGERSGSDDSVSVLGSDGAGGDVDATVLYQVDPERATLLFQDVGVDFLPKLIRPSARNCIRTEFANYPMVQGATASWQEVSDKVTACMKEKVQPRGVLVQDFQLREVVLGKQVQEAVDDKAAAQQRTLQQQFEKQTATQQADIDRVKALATADAQQLVACGGSVQTVERNGQSVQEVVPNPIDRCSQAQLTPEYLQYTYILALKGLVNSPNASTIILPFDQNLTPLINVGQNGQVNTRPQATAPAAPATPAPPAGGP